MINESDLFEENDLYIVGNKLKDSTNKILSEFDLLFETVFQKEKCSNEELKEIDITTQDIYIKSIEEDIQQIIDDNKEKINKKKKIFSLEKKKNNESTNISNNSKRPNHLRNEAKLLEESINNLVIPSYQELKARKISDTKLFSYHFFKSFCKKEIGKENNYIFNFKDNYLNDMSKIDKEFFEDFYRNNKKEDKAIDDISMLFPNLFKEKIQENQNRKEKQEDYYHDKEIKLLQQPDVKEEEKENATFEDFRTETFKNENNMDIEDSDKSSLYFNNSFNKIKSEVVMTNNEDHGVMSLEKNKTEVQESKNICDIYKARELVYEFAVYHPLKNNKTQEILIVGSAYLNQLKDKIYCVLDEIQNSETDDSSFFFIENCFYNDTRNSNSKILSSKILENKIRKLNCFNSTINENYNVINKTYNLNNNSTLINNNSCKNDNFNLNENMKFQNNFLNNNNNNNNSYFGTPRDSNFLDNINNEDCSEDDYKDNKNFYNFHIPQNNKMSTCSESKDDLKFPYYIKDLYSIPMYISNEIYDEISMSDKKINDITFRIGYPYLFRHIDHCDHMIMLTDIRYVDESDRFDDENRCFVTFQKKLKRRICDACSFYYAKFISINDKITSDYKVLFYCESCLKKIHASEFKDSAIPHGLKLIPYFHD